MTCNRYSTRTRFNLPFHSFFNFLFQIFLSLSSSSFRDLGFTWIFKLSFFSRSLPRLINFYFHFLPLSSSPNVIIIYVHSFRSKLTQRSLLSGGGGKERRKRNLRCRKGEIGERGERDQEKRRERTEISERHFRKREVI